MQAINVIEVIAINGSCTGNRIGGRYEVADLASHPVRRVPS